MLDVSWLAMVDAAPSVTVTHARVCTYAYDAVRASLCLLNPSFHTTTNLQVRSLPLCFVLPFLKTSVYIEGGPRTTAVTLVMLLADDLYA